MYQKLITLIKKVTKLTDENYIEALTARVDWQLDLEESRIEAKMQWHEDVANQYKELARKKNAS